MIPIVGLVFSPQAEKANIDIAIRAAEMIREMIFLMIFIPFRFFNLCLGWFVMYGDIQITPSSR